MKNALLLQVQVRLEPTDSALRNVGTRRFMPNESANPYVGRTGVVERVSEGELC